MDGEVLLEDEVATVFDLRDRIEARQIDLLALFVGELGPEDEGPVVEALADDGGAQFVCGSLQGSNIVNSEEGIVVLAEGDLRTIELLLDEVVAVDVVGCLEGKEGRHTHDKRPQHFIADVEVVMGEAAPLGPPGCDGSDPGWDTWAR